MNDLTTIKVSMRNNRNGTKMDSQRIIHTMDQNYRTHFSVNTLTSCNNTVPDQIEINSVIGNHRDDTT